MKKIFIVNGCGGVGKTTFEQIVEDIIHNNDTNINVEIISIIDYIKHIAYKIGWNGHKDLKGRKLLSGLKDILTEYNDIPYQKLQKTIEDITDNSVIFIDSREKADIERLVNDYHAKTILITNSLKDKITYGNHADDNVNDYNYDIYIDNCGSLDELKEKAIDFCKNNIV